jgi:hypothetical protein
MPIVMCPSCGRFNNCPTQRPKGLFCEMCRALLDTDGDAPATDAPPSPPVPEARPFPAIDAAPQTIDVVPIPITVETDFSWRHTGGRLVASSGVSLMSIGGLVVMAGATKAERFGVYSVIVGTVMGAIGGGLWNLGQRLAAPSVAQAEANDPRAPILLLRRFRDDNRDFGVRDPATPFVPYSSLEQHTFEQMVTERFAAAGPVVAIGKPGESLPSLGAARMYVGNDEWQAKIEEYLPRAGRIVMILGRIEGEVGLAWELRNIWATVAPERVVFVVPPVDEIEAKTRWAALVARSEGRVPPYEGGELAASFDADGRCEVVRSAPGDRLDRAEEYREALAKIVRAELPASDVDLVSVPSDPNPRAGKRRWPYPLASWQSALALFVASQVFLSNCMNLGGSKGGFANNIDLGSAAAIGMVASAIVGLIFFGAFFASILLIYDRKVKGIRPTDLTAGILSTGMLVSWIAALVIAGMFVVAAFKSVVLGIPPDPNPERTELRKETEIKPFQIE